MIEKYQKNFNDITNDQMCINMLEGASFSSGATIILPSGRKISGKDANILVSKREDELSSIPNRDREGRYSSLYEDNLKKYEDGRKKRYDYLTETEAVPVTPEMYATWLYVWMLQGGEVTHDRDHRMPSFDLDSPYADDLYKNPFLYWSPTSPTDAQIPKAYGSNSLDLLVFADDMTDVNTRASSQDRRPGWEYGHTNVKVLKRNRTKPLGYEAVTNKSYIVESFTDVNEIILRIANTEQHPKVAIDELLQSQVERLPSLSPKKIKAERDVIDAEWEEDRKIAIMGLIAKGILPSGFDYYATTVPEDQIDPVKGLAINELKAKGVLPPDWDYYSIK